jgi:hypothetical protein
MPIAAGRAIPPEWAGKYPVIGGIKPKEWDGFHDLVLWDELYRGGAVSSIFVGLVGLSLSLSLFLSFTAHAYGTCLLFLC